MPDRPRSFLTIVSLLCLPSILAGQTPAVRDSEYARALGHWIASGVSFQSGGGAHQFACDLKLADGQIQITLPSELKLAGGDVYSLTSPGSGVFRHTDSAGRVVEFSLVATGRASLLITGSRGDGRVTWQLTR